MCMCPWVSSRTTGDKYPVTVGGRVFTIAFVPVALLCCGVTFSGISKLLGTQDEGLNQQQQLLKSVTGRIRKSSR